MSNFFSLLHFGDINISKLDERYDATIDLNGQKISIDINFQGKSIDSDAASAINNFISNIASYDNQNKLIIEKDFDNENDPTVREYIEFHLEEFEQDELAEFVDFNNKDIDPEKQLLKKLKLVRAGLYPDGAWRSENFAVFDYTIDREITDQLIVVKTNHDNTFKELCWES